MLSKIAQFFGLSTPAQPKQEAPAVAPVAEVKPAAKATRKKAAEPKATTPRKPRATKK